MQMLRDTLAAPGADQVRRVSSRTPRIDEVKRKIAELVATRRWRRRHCFGRGPPERRGNSGGVRALVSDLAAQAPVLRSIRTNRL